MANDNLFVSVSQLLSMDQNVLDMLGLSNIEKEKIYSIPPYQREYSWKYKKNAQCDVLLQDIESFTTEYYSKSNNDLGDFYTLGSVILNPQMKNGNYTGVIDIIDGQQRITTFMLMLKALLLEVNSALNNNPNEDDLDELETIQETIWKCLYQVKDVNVKSIRKGRKELKEFHLKLQNLSINEESVETKDRGEMKSFTDFETIIKDSNGGLNDEGKPDDNNIIRAKYKITDESKYTNYFNNFNFFYGKFSSIEGKNDGGYKYWDTRDLIKFAQTLLDRCKLVILVPGNEKRSVEVFNCLNSKGMPLTTADIISATLYGNCKQPKEKKEFENSWKDILARTNKLEEKKICDIDALLNQYMYINRAKDGEKDTTLPSVRNYFTMEKRKLLDSPTEFIDDLGKIIECWEDRSDKINSIDNLRQILLKFNVSFKFYYATYMFFRSNDSDETKQEFIEKLLKLFVILEVLDYGYSSSYFKTFLIATLNIKIANTAEYTTEDIIQELNNQINKFKKDEETFCKNLIAPECASGLVYLNDFLFAREKDESLDLKKDGIDIEHIMPQSWKNGQFDCQQAGYRDSDECKDYLNKLGNKILLEFHINRRISDEWFKDKCENEDDSYKESEFPLAKSLAEHRKKDHKIWKKQDVEETTKKAAKRIYKFVFNEAPMNEWFDLDYDVEEDEGGENTLSTADVDTARGSKKERFRFDDAGIPIGAKLTLADNPQYTAVVCDTNNKVMYNGVKYAISTLAEELLGRNSLQGARYWEYDGKRLTDIRADLEVQGLYGKMNN